jgi:hypothetical protein
MTIDEVLDAVFGVLASPPNAASLGTKEINFQESYGLIVHSVKSAFIPVTSPNDGLLVSRTRAVTPPRSGQVEGGLAYTNIRGLDRVSQPGGVARMFMLHLNPPGTKAAIVKVAGWIYHFSASGAKEAIEDHVIRKAEFDFDTPGGAIVFSGMNLDERFTKLRVLNETSYEPLIVPRICELVRADLQEMQTYIL